jgi:hypothetical protein
MPSSRTGSSSGSSLWQGKAEARLPFQKVSPSDPASGADPGYDSAPHWSIQRAIPLDPSFTGMVTVYVVGSPDNAHRRQPDFTPPRKMLPGLEESRGCRGGIPLLFFSRGKRRPAPKDTRGRRSAPQNCAKADAICDAGTSRERCLTGEIRGTPSQPLPASRDRSVPFPASYPMDRMCRAEVPLQAP